MKTIPHDITFLVVWILLLFIFVYKMVRVGVKNGLISTILLWSTLVVLTPIPEAGIIITYPVYRYGGVHVVLTQFFVTILAFSIMFVCRNHSVSKTNYLLQTFNTKYVFVLACVLSIGATLAFSNSIQYVLVKNTDGVDNSVYVYLTIGIIQSVAYILLWYLVKNK
jgi:hypothetical protein